jgi:hypothetical protein
MMGKFLAILVATLFLAAPALAAPAHGTAAEAKAMLDRAVVELKADPVAALARFNQKDGGFRDRDLYVACFDARTGIVQAHVDPKQLGVDIRTLKQPNGQPFGKKLFDAAKPGIVATVDYQYVQPGGTRFAAKRSYVTRVGLEACLVGFYK